MTRLKLKSGKVIGEIKKDITEKLLEEISNLDDEKATARMQQIYSEPIKPELIRDRLAQIRAGGVVVVLEARGSIAVGDSIGDNGLDFYGDGVLGIAEGN